MLSRRFLMIVALMVLCTSAAFATEAKYVFIMIGDGMGPEQVKAGGMYVHGAPGTMSWEGFPFRSDVKTDSATGITDSAAAATAIATGVVVNNRVISMSLPGDGSRLKTMLQHYKEQGRSTGLVATGFILDATPAGFAAHAAGRGDHADVMATMMETRPTVLMGGGKSFNLDMARDAGYVIAQTKDQMKAAVAKNPERLAAIFGDGALPYELDGLGDFPALVDMTIAAIKVLEKNEKGFFVMIEGSRIDHAGHSNDIDRMARELAAFDLAVQEVIRWSAGREDVLIVVAADHETGGLTVIENKGKGNIPEVKWGTTKHTATPVGVSAWGAGAQRFTSLEHLKDIHAAVLAPAPAKAQKEQEPSSCCALH